MTWNATVEEPNPPVPAGQYGATPTGIQDTESQHGATVRIDFTLSTDDEWDGRQVSGLANKRLNENTKLGQWVAAILGRMPAVGEEVTAEHMLHRRCLVVVRHKTNDDGRTFANVIEVLPVTAVQPS